MGGRKTQYYYVLPRVTSDRYTIEVEVERCGNRSKSDFAIGFEHGMPPEYRAMGLLAVIKELQEIVMLNFDIIDNNISLDDIF